MFLHVSNNNENIAALSEACSFLDISLSFLPGPSDSDSASYAYVATDSCSITTWRLLLPYLLYSVFFKTINNKLNRASKRKKLWDSFLS